MTSGAHCGSTGTVPATIHATLRQRLTPLAMDELRLGTAHAVSVQGPAHGGCFGMLHDVITPANGLLHHISAASLILFSCQISTMSLHLQRCLHAQEQLGTIS